MSRAGAYDAIYDGRIFKKLYSGGRDEHHPKNAAQEHV